MTKSLRAAVIGLGPHGRRVVRALAAAGLELVAVADGRAEALAWDGLPPDVRRHEDAGALFREARAELVCVATNGPSHARLAIDAMQAGAGRVLVEKPFACSLAEADEMLATAERLGARLAVDHLRRKDPICRFLRERVAAGGWGRLRLISIQRPGIGLGCLGTHSFDLVHFVAGRAAERVTAWVDAPVGKNPRGAEFVDPGGLVVLELGGGARAVVAQIEDGAGPPTIELDLTAARVRVDEKSGAVEVVERDLAVATGPDRPPVYRAGEAPAAGKAALEALVKDVLVELAGDGPMESMDCDARHGRASLEVLVAAHLSAREGQRPVELPLASLEARRLWLPIT